MRCRMITAVALLATVLLGGCATYPQYTYGYGLRYYESYPGTYPYGYSYGYTPRFPYEYYGGNGAGGGNS